MKSKYLFGLSLLLIVSALHAEPRYNEERVQRGRERLKFSEQGPQDSGPRAGAESRPMFQAMRELNLTAEQRAKLAKMMRERQASGAKNPRLEVMKAVQELNDAIAEGSDEKINASVDKIRASALRASETSRQFQEMLNDEQRLKLTRMRERMQERKSEFRQEFRENFKQRKGERGGAKP